jgi:transposase
MKKSYTPKQKASIALMAIRGESVSKLASQYQIHPTQINTWKKVVEDEMATLFVDKRKKENFGKDKVIDELYRTIGQREVEISWLKKKFNLELPREIILD